jgi:predicted RNA polymerase sigma factor
VSPPALAPAAELLLRELAPRALGALVRKFHDFSAAEDAVQEAQLAAVAQWPRDGVPDNPLAWLLQVASRRFSDHVRSEIARRRREAIAAIGPGFAMPALPSGDAAETDDTLILLFLCCHSSLTTPSAIALTLRAVGGLTTAEIARAFLVPEATMAQRITRAKQTIKESGVPFRLPSQRERGQRLSSVLHVLYLMFNEGYTASSGAELQRCDLSTEAIRLTRLVNRALPTDPEIAGLLALMLLTDARRLARTGPQSQLIPLDEQNRSIWNGEQIAEGIALLSEALSHGSAGPYQLQAAIAAVHDEAASAQETDWPQILALYDLLKAMSANPLILLNRAVAFAMVHGPRAGLDQLDALASDSRLKDNHRVDAVRAHLLEMAGEREAAIAFYQAAAARATSLPERDYLLLRGAKDGP